MSLHIQGVYVADGFADDCDELIHRCQAFDTLTYEAFSNIWKEMRLSYTFHNRLSGAEIAELSEEVIHIAKYYMVANTSNFEESVAGLFLVYALLNLQPFAGFASIRIVQEDLPAIERIEQVARRDRRLDVLYILGSVLIQGPVQYQAALRERGMEYPLRKYLEGYTTMTKLGVRPKGVFYRQNKELDIIRELNTLAQKYTKVKEEIAGTGVMDRNLTYLDENFAKKLDISLKNIISGIIDDEPDKDVEDKATQDNIDAIKSIKDRALMSKVNPIRHRMGVSSRPGHSMENDLKPQSSKMNPFGYKYKRGSNAAWKRKRKASFESSSDEENDRIKEDFYNCESDYDSNQGDDIDIEKFNKIVPEGEQVVEIEIDSLPWKIRSEDDAGKEYEIEIIDNLDSANQDVREINDILQSVASTSRENDNMGEIIKKAERKDLKKTLLKSRFKRMGMLPVANFQSK